MHHKTVVRKRIVKVTGAAPLVSGADIVIGETPIGRVGSVSASSGLAMLRLDRAAEAADKGQTLSAGGVIVTPDPEALGRYLSSSLARTPAPERS
jgi:tRNA-modifying protein YgfZ